MSISSPNHRTVNISSIKNCVHFALTQWPWEDAAVFAKYQFQPRYTEYLGTRCEISSGQCQRTSLTKRVNIGSGNDLVQWGNNLLPEPMLTNSYVIIWRYKPQWVKNNLQAYVKVPSQYLAHNILQMTQITTIKFRSFVNYFLSIRISMQPHRTYQTYKGQFRSIISLYYSWDAA